MYVFVPVPERMVSVEVSGPDHMVVFCLQYGVGVILHVSSEGGFVSGVGTVVVYVEDGEGAVCTFELDSCYVVRVGDVQSCPVFCVESLVNPYY